MDKDAASLIEGLQSEDELGAVIRAHLYIESYLIQLIEKLIPDQEHLDNMRLNYSQRIDLALALGLIPRFGPPLRILGKIRNDFAHRLDAKLSKKHVTDLYGALDQEDREIILQSFKEAKKKLPEAYPQTFKSLETKDKFIFIVITLRAILLAAAI